MRFFLPFLFFFVFLFADTKIHGVNFSDQEINMTLLELNYADYQDLYNILHSSYKTNEILDYRFDNRSNGGITNLQDLVVKTGLSSHNLYDLKMYAYKWTADMIVKPIGTTYPLTNFLFALAGILIGFTILLAIVLHFAR